MNFIHEDPEFDDLLRIVADQRRLAVSLIEKDYWVMHTLWALHDQGFDVWFKGGTSLSKGFDLIERFSEDLDLKIEPGRVTSVPVVGNWKSEGKKATAERQEFFERLTSALIVPGAQARLEEPVDAAFRSANIQVEYPGRHASGLPEVLKPFVLLEVGSARVTPCVARDMTSFVHEYLTREGQLASFRDNRPMLVRCVHPLVTLIEKLDALMRRLPRESVEPATFVRHFEDAARIIRARGLFAAPEGCNTARELVEEMLAQKQVSAIPTAAHAAFTPDGGERWAAVRRAHAAIGPMFWGARTSVDDACWEISEWIASELG